MSDGKHLKSKLFRFHFQSQIKFIPSIGERGSKIYDAGKCVCVCVYLREKERYFSGIHRLESRQHKLVLKVKVSEATKYLEKFC